MPRDAEGRKVTMHSTQGDQKPMAMSEASTQRRKGRSLSSEQWEALKEYADANQKDRRMVDWEEVDENGGVAK